MIKIIIIESSRGSFAKPSYGVQEKHRIYLLIGHEPVFEENAPYAVEGWNFHGPQRDTA